MIREVYISFVEKLDIDWPPLVYYRYSYLQALRALGYLTYKKIDIRIAKAVNENQETILEWDDNKHARIICYWESPDIAYQSTADWNLSLLRCIYNGLRRIWETHSWPINDLEAINNALITDPEKPVVINFRSKQKSPDGKFVIQFYCLIHQEFAEYYVSIKTKGVKGLKHLFFHKGFIEAEMFFMFFAIRQWESNYELELKNYSEEIIHYFNLETTKHALKIVSIENSIDYCRKMNAAFEAGLTWKEHRTLLGFK